MRLTILLILFTVFMTGISGCSSWRIEARHPPIGGFVKVGEEQLHYIDMGPRESDGPPIVLIHGASANLQDMKIALGDRLAIRYRVLAFDRPGRGYSTRPKDGHRLDVQARLIHDALGKLGVEKPIIIGQSLGGAVALAYTLQYHDEMAGAAYLAPVSHQWPGGVTWYNEVSGWPVIGLVLRRAIIPAYGRLKGPAAVEGVFWPQEAPENYFDQAAIALLFRPMDFKHNAEDIRKLKPQIITMMDRYDEISIPTLIYHGTHDTTVSPTIHSYALSRQITGNKLVFLPREGHGLHHTASDRIIEGIDGLVAEITGPAAQPIKENDTPAQKEEASVTSRQ